MNGRLVLFDIDGTLVDTGGAGMAALKMAGRDLFGAEGPELDLAGATDSAIVRGLFEHFEMPVDDENIRQFYQAYLSYLEEHLEKGGFDGRVLPGVMDLLEEFRQAGAVLGLLTGNIADGAGLKMRHYGMADYFSFGAFGDDHHDRNRLGPLALSRAGKATGRTYCAGETLVIGDTPKDIACGRAMGAITVCVGTGAFTPQQLRFHGADLVFEEFSGLTAIVEGVYAVRRPED